MHISSIVLQVFLKGRHPLIASVCETHSTKLCSSHSKSIKGTIRLQVISVMQINVYIILHQLLGVCTYKGQNQNPNYSLMDKEIPRGQPIKSTKQVNKCRSKTTAFLASGRYSRKLKAKCLS